MKYLIIAFSLFMSTAWADSSQEPAKTKRVCTMQKQADGKTREVCKTIKIHKKLESQTKQ
jgi:hypothetical protein